jgi:nicotinamidase-related amidase
MPLRLLFALVLVLLFAAPAWSDDPVLKLKLRTRPAEEQGKVVEKAIQWNPKLTAIIVVDMWDDHWCKSAAARVTEMAGPMNDLLKTVRSQGVFVIHAPSTTTDFYKDSPQRKRAQAAPFAATPVDLAKTERWGTGWCYPDAKREGPLPIDDSDMGCSCKVKCKIEPPWKRQIAAIEIAPEDAVTDNGQETWNLLAERKIDNVLILGVHLNMCVLGRPFAIRQQRYLGKNIVLVRDMTDTMYNPEMRPKVSHFEGTDLVVEHVEKFWCPTILSTDLTGKPAFQFKEDPRGKDGKK